MAEIPVDAVRELLDAAAVALEKARAVQPMDAQDADQYVRVARRQIRKADARLRTLALIRPPVLPKAAAQ